MNVFTKLSVVGLRGGQHLSSCPGPVQLPCLLRIMTSTEQKSLPVIKQNVDGALNSRSTALIMAGAIIRGLSLQRFFPYMQHSQEYLLMLTS